jgi:hypothetical protein
LGCCIGAAYVAVKQVIHLQASSTQASVVRALFKKSIVQLYLHNMHAAVAYLRNNAAPPAQMIMGMYKNISQTSLQNLDLQDLESQQSGLMQAEAAAAAAAEADKGALSVVPTRGSSCCSAWSSTNIALLLLPAPELCALLIDASCSIRLTVSAAQRCCCCCCCSCCST